MHGNWSFRTLLAGFLAVLGLGTAALGLSVWRDRADSVADGVRSAHNIAIVLGGQIERSMQSIDIVLRGLQRRINDIDLQTSSGGTQVPNSYVFREALVKELALLPQAFELTVADASGQVMVSTAGWPTPNINVADREYFKDLIAADNSRLGISLPLVNPVNNESTIVLARRLAGPNGQFLGLVFASVKTAYFARVYDTVTAQPSQRFILSLRDGTILLRHPDSQDRSGQKLPANWPFHAIVQQGGGSYRSSGAFDQIPRWIAVKVLKEYPLVVAIGIPESVILENWRFRTAVSAAGAALFLMCALILLLIMSRQYAKLSFSEAGLAEKTQALEFEHQRLLQNEALLRENEAALRSHATRLLKSETALRKQNERFDAALNNMSQGLAMFDQDARLVVCNARYMASHRLSPDQAQTGRPLRDIIVHCHQHCGFPDDVDEYMAKIGAMAASGKSSAHEIQDIDGRVFSITNDPMPSGGWVVTFEDITDRRASARKIERLAHSDILTGIANRPRFLELIDEARRRLQADGQPFTVLMLDLDRLKYVNDSFGHAAGDDVLKETARRLEASLRGEDVVARLGGDEFAVIQTPPREFSPADDSFLVMRESAITLANRIIDCISTPYDVDGRTVAIGTSIGIAMAPRDASEPDPLMKMADLALYEAKSAGRNGYVFFDVRMAADQDKRNQLEVDLRTALDRNEFELHYQPMIDAGTRQLCGMEALVRWHHPGQGLIAPDRFIALAEETGLVTSLGAWVLQTVCNEAANWPPHVKVAINLSPIQFRKTNLFDVVMCALVDSGLPPERLEVEITERFLLEKDANYFSTLHQLRNLGISIVLDDFGVGNSSLGYLKMFPFDKVKIDPSFTHDVMERTDCAAIVCAVANLGRALDIVTVAEGVETPSQFQALRAAGVTQMQGFLFGHPAPAAKIVFDAVDCVFSGATARTAEKESASQ